MPDILTIVVFGVGPEATGLMTTLVSADPGRVRAFGATLETIERQLQHPTQRPDVIVIATSRPASDAPPLIRRLRLVAQPAPISVLSDLDDDNALLTVLRSGAAGYLLTKTPPAELTPALERIAAGQTIIDPTMAGRIVAQIAHGEWRGGPVLTGWDLTPRERQVLDSLIEGRSNRQIAEDLNLGQETIKTYLRTLYRKLGARDRNHATAIVLGRQSPQQPPS